MKQSVVELKLIEARIESNLVEPKVVFYHGEANTLTVEVTCYASRNEIN